MKLRALGSGAAESRAGSGLCLRQGSLDSTGVAATAFGAGGVGGSGGITLSPGTAYTTTRWFLPSSVATNCFT